MIPITDLRLKELGFIWNAKLAKYEKDDFLLAMDFGQHAYLLSKKGSNEEIPVEYVQELENELKNETSAKHP